MSRRGSPQLWAVISAIAVVLCFDQSAPTSAKENGCTCDQKPGRATTADASCWWSIEELRTQGGPKFLDPEDSCNWGERYASYDLGTQGGKILEGSGWAFVNCFLGTTPAIAERDSASSLFVRFRLNNPCAGCVGDVDATFAPSVQLCAWAISRDSHAAIAAGMHCESSVADSQDRKTDVFAQPLAAAAIAYNGPGQPSGFLDLPLPTADGGSLTFPLGGGNSLQSYDVDQIGARTRKRQYRVGKRERWEISFTFFSSLGVDVIANDMAVTVSEAIARAGRSTWDTRVEFACAGGCQDDSDAPGLGRWDFQRGILAAEPECEKPKH